MARLSPPLMSLGFLIAPLCALPAAVVAPQAAGLTEGDWERDLFDDGKIRLIFRTDDLGFCHTSNVAFEQTAEEGFVSAVSVLVNTPWLDEAVEMLRRHPEISVGVHLCLNSEWELYRWGPVLPIAEVPSLVDEWGKFFPSRALFNANEPRLEEIDRELRAQIDLALRKGLDISHFDHHMGTAAETRERRAVLERIADDYDLAISRWFGERQVGNVYMVEPEDKPDALLESLSEITEPGTYLVVSHTGLETPEMMAMSDAHVHPWAPQPMAAHRAAELRALCDPRLRALVEGRGWEIIGYDVLRERFLDRMSNPYPDDDEDDTTAPE